MKRQNRFIIALLSAGITFATLTATLGTDHWKSGYYYGHRCWDHHDHHYHHNHDNDQLKGEDTVTGKDKDSAEVE